MEFVEYLLALIALFLVWKKPEKERLAFGILWVCIIADIAIWIVSSAASWLPGFTL